ncbi:MAG: hypothetical protein B5M53_00015 [Candidatus Cloacimonas sp. 4484_209]|nr:MAG: hypothetical protein B5M53_00015 [Candidatus Cloacimonas sp. 4484_209]
MKHYNIFVEREEGTKSIAFTEDKQEETHLCTSLRDCNTLNPKEIFLSSIGGCILRNSSMIVSQKMRTKLLQAYVKVSGEKISNSPKMTSISYNLTLITDKPVNKTLLMSLVQKKSLVLNSLSPSIKVRGHIVNKVPK